MLGLNDKSWLVEKLYETRGAHFLKEQTENGTLKTRTYDTYFGLGECIKLIDEPGVFKVSPAGMALGNYLLKALNDDELSGRCLDVGTGSGVLALLLRGMGAENIVGTDISNAAVNLARRNEELNFGDSKIQFTASDLFSALPHTGRKFDTVIFNPPGWRTPSAGFMEHLLSICGNEEMDPSAMFCGDQVLLGFLKQLPFHLGSNGRAIIGLNSMVGIKDVLLRYKNEHHGVSPLQFRLLERHTFPLIFYSKHWENIGPRLLEEFASWQQHHQSAYSLDSQGTLYWSYEIVECKLNAARTVDSHD